MGQSSSADESKKVKRQEPPTFAEVMRRKADEANQKKEAAFVALLDLHLTPEALAKDVQHCVEVVTKELIAQAEFGSIELSKQFPSPLFCSTWTESRHLLTDAGYSLFHDKLCLHASDICAEFARRTHMPVSATQRPGFVIQKDYRSGNCIRVSDWGHFSFQVQL